MNKRKLPLDETTVNDKHDPPLKLRRQLHIQNFVLVWLDSKINKHDEQFHHIVDTINTFIDVDQCLDFLSDIEDQKIFLIMSDDLDQQLISLIHDISQLYSIYIFCEEKSEHEICIHDWKKIRGGFIRIEDICYVLKQDIKQCEHDLASISIVPPSHFSQRNLNELEPSFMYSKLLKEILFYIEHDQYTKRELTQLLREQYHNNNSQLKIINEFEEDYNENSAVRWYT